MKNALNSLSFMLSIFLNSACASAMGRAPACTPPALPTRPAQTICISNEQGVGKCFNQATGKPETNSMKNYLCRSPKDDTNQEEWIDSLLRSIEHEPVGLY